MNTHFNTGYLSEQLAGFPDQEMVYAARLANSFLQANPSPEDDG